MEKGVVHFQASVARSLILPQSERTEPSPDRIAQATRNMDMEVIMKARSRNPDHEGAVIKSASATIFRPRPTGSNKIPIANRAPLRIITGPIDPAVVSVFYPPAFAG